MHDRRSKSYGINQTDDKKKGTCKVCGASHTVWNCDVFKSRSIQEKWATAKKLGLCNRCLGDDHLSGECPRSTVCNIDGCRDRHNRLLHGNRNGTKPQFRPLGSQPQGTQLQGTKSNDSASVNKNDSRRDVQFSRNDDTLAQVTQGQDSMLSTEGDANINSTALKMQEKTQADTVALRTVPAILKYGTKKMLVNCFLDEGSNTTYVNEDVVEDGRC